MKNEKKKIILIEVTTKFAELTTVRFLFRFSVSSNDSPILKLSETLSSDILPLILNSKYMVKKY